MPMDKEASVRLEVAQGPASHSIPDRCVFLSRCSRDRGSDAIVPVFVRPTTYANYARLNDTPDASGSGRYPSWEAQRMTSLLQL